MTTSTDSTPTSAPPPLNDTRPRLERSSTDRYVGGVCGGLGRYFDIDPVIIRVAIACLTIFGGAGVLMYVVAWLLIPDEGRQLSAAQAARRDGARGRELLILAVVVIAGLVSVGAVFDHGAGDGDWVLPVLLLAGYAWWRRDSRSTMQPPATFATASSIPDAPPESSAYWAATATTPPLAAPAPPHWSVPAPKKRRERSQLGSLTFSALLIGIGLAALLDTTGTADISLQGVLAGAVLIVGIGLVAGAWYGRSRGLIALGVLLALAVSVVSLVDVPWRGGTGDVTWQLTRVDQLDDGYHLKVGAAVLDLTAVEFGEGRHAIDANVGFGELTVLVPEGVSVRVTGHIGAGDVTVFGAPQQDGFDLDLDIGDPSTADLTINTRMGLGELQVRHEAS
ncbi:MAG: PspC domain-containing protein [Mycobacteriales bacterium]